MPSDSIAAVQRHYPQIYLACHVDHVRRKSTAYRISAGDAALLSHLDGREPVRAGDLARHLGVAASTLTAALQRLEALGYLRRTPRPRDRRNIELRLTPQGAEAMSAASVLDRARIAALLARLSPAECRRAIAGLGLLARAAAELEARRPGRAAR